MQVGLLFHIIEKMGPIPWNDLTLPPGRTLKAVQVMIDKEKTKIKKARAAELGEDEAAGGAENANTKAAAKLENKVRASLTRCRCSYHQ